MRLVTAYSDAHEEADEDGHPGTVGMDEPEFKPGDICGDWMIERFVAAGGMGEVYKVRGTLGGLFGALKRMRRELVSTKPGAEKRFVKEVEILAALECPYIVRLLHAGKHQGMPYLVTEWLEGMTLRDFLNQQRKPIPLDEALHYAICIAIALSAAHASNVLHRDLKPENIFMLERGTLKVLDFGLGKWASATRTSSTSGLAGMCTVHYASPEQLARKGVDERTDVYALALIFVEMVTLRWAFSDQFGGLPARDMAVANQLFAEPNSLRGVLPPNQAELAALIDAALSKDKERRPRSSEFLAGLRGAQRALHGRTVAEPDDNGEVFAATVPRANQSLTTIETSSVRTIHLVRTETLPPNSPVGDPTAGANPAPPLVRTIKMARPTDADLDAARREESTSSVRSADVGDTSGERAALLPDVTATSVTSHSAVSVTQTPSQPRGTMPQNQQTTPPRPDVPRAERESLELASRPTVPWQRPVLVQEQTSSLTPMHQGVAAPAAPSSRRLHLWVAPLLGAALVLVPFMVMRSVRRHPGRNITSGQAAALGGAAPSTASALPSAVNEPPPSVTLSPTSAAAVPGKSIAAADTATATPAESASQISPLGIVPSAVTTASTKPPATARALPSKPPKQAESPKASAAPAPSATLTTPAPAAKPESPPTNPGRLFGSDN
ncbi:Serine/threonine protein kinase [Minicystis rosea]|nr:Serine/threonine protein kinase [Minicystis rosea]